MKTIPTFKVFAFVLAFLLLAAAQATQYYVNDASTNGIVFCTAPGTVTNTALSPDSPMLSLAHVLDAYTLGAGDEVLIDSGFYPESANVEIESEHGGTAVGEEAIIRGAGAATVLSRGSTGTGAYALHVKGASHLILRDLRVTQARQGVRVEGGGNVTLSNCVVDACTVGVVLTDGSGHRVTQTTVTNCTEQGVLSSSSPGAVVIGSVLDANGGTTKPALELFASAAAMVRGNLVSGSGTAGIRVESCAGALVESNRVWSSGEEGLYLKSSGSMRVAGNLLRGNAGAGLAAQSCSGLEIEGNRIYNNTGSGLAVSGSPPDIHHNLVYANGNDGLLLNDAGAAQVLQNTFYRNGAAAVALEGGFVNARLRGNILSAHTGQHCLRVASLGAVWNTDYNAYQVTGGGHTWSWQGTRYTLGSWQRLTGQDSHSLDVDPLFVNPAGEDGLLGGANGDDDNFHLQSTDGSYMDGAWQADAADSPCLDAGDPEADSALEPIENGGRINIGVYGGTPEASLSPGERRLLLLSPPGGAAVFRRTRVRWAAAGPWETNDTVRIEYSSDGGGTWLPCPNANPLLQSNGIYGWDLTGLTPGETYRVRVTANAFAVSTASAVDFAVLDPAPRLFYVNDASTAGDAWCTAAGGRGPRAGLTAAEPSESIEWLFDRFPQIGAGDEARVDAGAYADGRLLLLRNLNRLHEPSPLLLRGHPGLTSVIGPGDSAMDAVRIEDEDRITLRDLVITGARNGLVVQGTSADPCEHVAVEGGRFHQLAGTGVWVEYARHMRLDGLRSDGNALEGARIARHTGDLTITNCVLNANGKQGIYLASTVEKTAVWDSELEDNVNQGLSCGAPLGAFTGNTLRRNGGDGLYASTIGAPVYGATNNLCEANSGRGLFLYGHGSTAFGNRLVANGSHGLYLNEASGYRNIACSNALHGIQLQGDSETARHNIAFDNAGAQLRVLKWNKGGYATVEHNSLLGTDGISIEFPEGVTVRNNIVWARGTGGIAYRVETLPDQPAHLISNFNNLHATDGAQAGYWLGPRPTLAAWQQVTGRDAQSISIDPQWVDAPADFHLQSPAGAYAGAPFTAPDGGIFEPSDALSFCIDAADPASAHAQESAPHGGRANLGAFGNTPDASRSPDTRAILLAEPQPGAEWFGVQAVTWLTRGPWEAGDQVDLELSLDGGETWVTITNGLDYADGRYDWDTGSVSPTNTCLLRIIQSGGGAADTLPGTFTISETGPRFYYVNDGSTDGDTWCSAPGSPANDGLTPATPLDALQTVIDSYRLFGGDTVRIDTGAYTLSATVVITAEDAGEPGNPVCVVGSPNGAVLNRNNASYDTFFIDRADHVRIEALTLRGGRYGLLAQGLSSVSLAGLELVDCTATNNANHNTYLNYTAGAVVSGGLFGFPTQSSRYGLYANYATDLTVEDATFRNNTSSGLYISNSDNVVVRACLAHQNGSGGGIKATDAASHGLVEECVAWGNAGSAAYGISVGQRWTVQDCTAYENGNGISANNSSSGRVLLLRNRAWLNAGVGLHARGGDVLQNVSYGNGTYGLSLNGSSETARNNLVYDSGTANLQFPGSSGLSKAIVEQNTFAGGSGVRVPYAPSTFTFRNNIVQCSGIGKTAIHVTTPPSTDAGLDCEWNLWHVTDGARFGYWEGAQPTLADWRFISGRDGLSFEADPGFVDPAGPDGIRGGVNGLDDNFRLASTAGSYTGLAFTAVSADEGFVAQAFDSPGVDAADPALDAGDEWEPHAGRRNLGAFGGTPDASLSPGVRRVTLDLPREGAVLRGDASVAWHTAGPWKPDDTLAASLSDDGGATWASIPGGAGLAFADGRWQWDTSGLAPGSAYRLILGATDDGGVASTSGIFRVIAPVPTTFYVNDTNTVGDLYCTAAGDPTHDAISAATPLDNVRAVLRDYTLGPGDTVLVDSGTWALDASILTRHSGSAAEPLRIAGATNGFNTLLLGVEGMPVLRTENSHYLRLEALAFSGGNEGVRVNAGTGTEIVGCRFSGMYAGVANDNGTVALLISACHSIQNTRGVNLTGSLSEGLVENSTFVSNIQYGVSCRDGTFTVSGNTAHRNAIGINTVSASKINIVENRVFMNTSHGCETDNGGMIQRNIVYSNAGYGIQASDYATVLNNLVYDNTKAGIYGDAYGNTSGSLVIRGNTVVASGIPAIQVYRPTAHGARIDHNIVVCTGSGQYGLLISDVSPGDAIALVSDHNLWHLSSGASPGYWRGRQPTLADWQYASGQDRNSLQGDPLLVDPAGADGIMGGDHGMDDNFHLQSTAGSYRAAAFTAQAGATFVADAQDSPGLDAGDPTLPTDDETAPHGNRRNLGAFGGTADASLSPMTLGLALTSLPPATAVRGTHTLTWRTGGPWSEGDTVRIEIRLSGGEWQTLTGAATVAALDGTWTWDSSGLEPGTHDLRVVHNETEDLLFETVVTIIAAGATEFYVNDASTDGDVYCSAAGSAAHDGLAPIRPRESLWSLLRDYRLVPGDIVWIDTGAWSVDGSLPFRDSGVPGAPIAFRGSPDAAGSVHTRVSSDEDVAYADGVSNVVWRALAFNGGRNGLRLSSGQQLEFHDGSAGGNGASSAGAGLLLSDIDQARVSGSSFANNVNAGIQSASVSGMVVSNCASVGSRYGIYARTSSGAVIGGLFQQHTYDGINMADNAWTIAGTECRENARYGIYAEGGSLICEANMAYLNTVNGLRLRAATARYNTVHANGSDGIACLGYNERVESNLSYANGGYALRVDRSLNYSSSSQAMVLGNTLHGGDGVYLGTNPRLAYSNNVVYASGSGKVALRVSTVPSGSYFVQGDYNGLFATGGATLAYWGAAARTTLADWRTSSGCDANTLSADPLFVSPAGADDQLGGLYAADDDFHLQSPAGSWHGGLWQSDELNSPCIDAGDPALAFDTEPAYHGLRRNLGRYGNTAEASKTDYGGAFHTLATAPWPANGGTIALWPPASGNLYPTNVLVTAVATPADYFTWNTWTGHVVSVANPADFLVSSNAAISALFTANVSNTRGTPDWWLAGHGFAVDDEGADDDADTDGQANWKEYVADTDPKDGDSFLRITHVVLGPPVAIDFEPASTARAYTLQATTNLLTGIWEDVPGQGPRAGAGEADAMNDNSTAPARFYRVQVEVP